MSFFIGLLILVFNIETYNTCKPGIAAVYVLPKVAPIQTILLVMIIVSVYFTMTLASGYAVKKVISRVLTDKSEGTLHTLIEHVIDRANIPKVARW